METKHCVAAALIVALVTTVAARAETVAELLHKGVYQEETAGNLDAAMRIYQQIVADEKSNRPYVAQARYRLGMCYLKRGQQNEVLEAFEKLIEEFPQQAKLVEQARAQLTALGHVPEMDRESRLVWSYPSLTLTMAPSPDGRYVAFQDADTGDLAIRDLEAGENRRLTRNAVPWEAYTGTMRFSPDGKWIAFVWYRGTYDQAKVDLRIIGTDGTGMRTVYQPGDEVKRILRLAWFPDGREVLTQLLDDIWKGPLVAVSVADGSVRAIGRRNQYLNHVCLSPDGRYLAYDIWDEGSRNIVTLAVEGGEEIPVVEHPANDIPLGWSPDGGMLVFRSNRRGQGEDAWGIQIVDGRPQGRPQCLKKNIDQAVWVPNAVHFTRDGSLYYSVAKRWRTDVYTATLDLETGKVSHPRRASQRPEGETGPCEWSPDGKYLLYTAEFTRHGGGIARPRLIVIRSVDTGQEREIPLPPEARFVGYTMSWSLDGRSILAVRQTQEGWELCRLDMSSGKMIPIVPPSNRATRPVGWSADGKKVFFVREDWDPATGIPTRHILAHNLETGREKELYRVDRGLGRVVLSPDRRQVVFARGGKIPDALMILPTEGGKAREIFRVQQGYLSGDALAWTPDGRHVLCSRRSQRAWLSSSPGQGKWRIVPNELWQIPVEGGKPQKLELPADIVFFGRPCVHPDGKQIALMMRNSPDDELWVMKSFLPDLALPQTLTGMDDPEHPFGLDVEVPDPNDDVKELAAKVTLSGDEDDWNATQWCDKVHQGKRGSLDGLWESRWRGHDGSGRGVAQVKTAGDWTYILYYGGGYYLIKARRQGDKLVGGWIEGTQNPPGPSHPWVGLIVNDERIDGAEPHSGRWDLRRNLPPSVELTSPARDSFVPLGEPVPLEAKVTTAEDITVHRVEFLIDGTPIGEDTSPPYQFHGHGAKQGQYSVTAKMYDSEGGAEETLGVDIFVGVRVRNASFEQDEAILKDPPWEGWVAYPHSDGSKVEIDTTESIDGARSLRIEPRAGSDEFCLQTRPIGLEKGQRCTLSFWAKAAAPRSLSAYFFTKDPSGQAIGWGSADFRLTTEWARYSTTSIVEFPAKLEFECAVTDDDSGGITFWLDLVSVEAEAVDEPD